MNTPMCFYLRALLHTNLAYALQPKMVDGMLAVPIDIQLRSELASQKVLR